MIRDSIVTIFNAVHAKNARGQVANAYVQIGQITANVQPVNFTGHQAEIWGVSDISSESKIMFFRPDDTVVQLGRVMTADGTVYEVRKVNKWGSPPFGHYEALLVPVQGDPAPSSVTLSVAISLVAGNVQIDFARSDLGAFFLPSQYVTASTIIVSDIVGIVPGALSTPAFVAAASQSVTFTPTAPFTPGAAVGVTVKGVYDNLGATHAVAAEVLAVP